MLNNHLKDPYDTYDYIASIQERGFKVNIFWLLGDFTKFDKNLSYKNWGQQAIIERFNIDKFIIGIHPSYKSNSYYYSIEDELNRLKSILKKEVIHSRQHFLRLNIHKTYSSLLKVGITNDYTMGYAENIGFRAGTARSFYWFDLLKNEKTNLLIHPFSYMDGTLNEYLKVSVEESKTLILKLFQELEKYGGDFMFIWHNETIGDYKKWKNWSEVLEFSLNLNKR
ncbi:MAG: polysaccharide deacetylase family protein [Flavobacteriia bacterium]|nr:polysaccharide deacetylase family protein [Flavobacteriia bacterium]